MEGKIFENKSPLPSVGLADIYDKIPMAIVFLSRFSSIAHARQMFEQAHNFGRVFLEWFKKVFPLRDHPSHLTSGFCTPVLVVNTSSTRTFKQCLYTSNNRMDGSVIVATTIIDVSKPRCFCQITKKHTLLFQTLYRMYRGWGFSVAVMACRTNGEQRQMLQNKETQPTYEKRATTVRNFGDNRSLNVDIFF